MHHLFILRDDGEMFNTEIYVATVLTGEVFCFGALYAGHCFCLPGHVFNNMVYILYGSLFDNFSSTHGLTPDIFVTEEMTMRSAKLATVPNIPRLPTKYIKSKPCFITNAIVCLFIGSYDKPACAPRCRCSCPSSLSQEYVSGLRRFLSMISNRPGVP